MSDRSDRERYIDAGITEIKPLINVLKEKGATTDELVNFAHRVLGLAARGVSAGNIDDIIASPPVPWHVLERN